MKSRRLAPFFVVAVVVSGCGPNFSTTPLAGSVTVDGEPVAEGSINFVPAGVGQGPSTSAPIIAGKYQASAPIGPVRVHFQATRETGKMIDVFGTPQPERVNLIPPRYHGGVEMDVSPQQSQHDFDLQSDASAEKALP